MASVPFTRVSTAAPASTGFLNLINFFLGSIEPAPPAAPPIPAAADTVATEGTEPGTKPAAQPGVRQIADAPFRAMPEKSVPPSPEILQTTAPVITSPVVPEQQPVPAAPAPASTTLEPGAATILRAQGPQVQGMPVQVPAGVAVQQQYAKPAPLAELAFSAYLKPIDASEPAAGAPQPGAAPALEPQPKQDAPRQEERAIPEPAPEAAPPRSATPETKLSSSVQKRQQTTERVMAAAASGATSERSGEGDFARLFETAVPQSVARPQNAEHANEPAVHALCEPAHVPEFAAASAPRPTAVQEITVRIARSEASPVDLHLVERAGEIHIAVRTPDTTLASSLRQDLGSLVSALERSGFHADTFVPRDIATHGGSAWQRNSGDDPQESQSRFAGYGESGGRQQQHQHHRRDQRGHAWLEELENSR